jgi:lipopolysaccharide export system permease protein
MKILSRYVLREFLVPLAYCLVGFLMIYVLFDLFGSFSRMAAAKISFGTAVLYFCGYLAPYFHYIVPAALMLATLYTLWTFCRHSELVAMRASGVSFLAIVFPLLAVAFILAVGVAAVNEVFVPSKATWAADMKTYQFDESRFAQEADVVFRNAKGSRTWQVQELLDKKAEHLKGVRVTVDRPNGGTRLLNVAAERADYLDGEWWFSNPKIQHYDEIGQETATPTPELDALTMRNFPEFHERPMDFLMQNRPWKFNSVRERLRYLRSHPELEKDRRRDYVYDVWAQALSPLACLVITLFAIPYGIATGRQSVFRGVLSALGMYFGFYGLIILMMILAKNGWFPVSLAAVLPYVTFFGLGVRAFHRQR